MLKFKNILLIPISVDQNNICVYVYDIYLGIVAYI